MKIAIIGAGHIASIHGPIIKSQPNVKITGLADIDLSRAKLASAQFDGCVAYQQAETMIDEIKPDIVHVLTPPQFHSQLSIMAMNRGCHVFVEKPMALNPPAAKDMIQAAQLNNVSLCVNHNMVFENVVQQAKGVCSSGAIGDIVSVEASYQFDARRYPAILEEGAEYCHWTYQLNGGPLQDLMPHPASLVFEFLPDIENIQFFGTNRGILPNQWADEIRVLINSQTIIGYISVSLSEKPDIVLLSIKGTKGAIQANLFSGILTLQKSSSLPRAINRGLSGLHITGQNLKGFSTNIYNFITGRMDRSNGVAPLITKFYESIRESRGLPLSNTKSLLVVDLMDRVWPAPVFKEKNIDIKSKPIQTSKSTALVTGASGFIGVHLIKKLLSEDVSVRALVRPNSIHAGRLKTLDVEILEGNLSDEKLLYRATKDIDTVYHAGSPMGNDRSEYEEIAVKGIDFLINACLRNNIKRFVQFSSLAVYELLKINNRIINENCSFHQNPLLMGPYAWAKIEIEKRVLDAFQKNGLPATVIRPGMVIGPLGRIFFPHLGYNLQERVFFIIGRGNIVLPLTYVENTVDGIYKAGTADNAIGQAYNIVDDGQITAQQYIEEFIKMAGDSRKLIKLPFVISYSATLAYEIAAALKLLKPGVTSRAQLKWKQTPVIFDSSKAKKELDWNPKVDIREGVSRTFNWYINKYHS